MATQVPYNPVPSVSLQERPTPFRSLDVPAGAFGAAQAAATQHLGAAFQQAGDQVFQRGYQMQEMAEQADANEKLTQFQNQQLQKFVEFQNTFGKDAYNHLPEFQAQMEALRSQIRGTLNSPYAQRAYDAESRNSQWRMNMSASFHAATQLKQYNDNQIGARIASNEDSVLANPEDYGAFTSKLGENEKLVREKYKDQSPEVIDQKVKESKWALAEAQVRGLADNHQAGSAGKLMKKYLADGTLGGDTQKLQGYIASKMATQYSKTQSEDIISGRDPTIGAGKGDINLAIEGLASIESNNKWIGRHNTPVKATSSHPAGVAVGRFGMMDYNIFGDKQYGIKSWLVEAGMGDFIIPGDKEGTIDKLIADHDAQIKLAKFHYNRLREQYGSDNEAARHWLGVSGSDANGMTADVYGVKFRGYLANHASEKVLSDIAEQVGNGTEKDTGIDGYSPTLTHQVIAKRNENDRMVAKDAAMSRQRIYGSMLPDDQGRLPTNTTELFARDPQNESDYNNMNRVQQWQVLKQLNANAMMGGYVATEEKKQQYLHFIGVYNDPNKTPEDMDWLQKQDVPGMQMPPKWQKQMLKIQSDLAAGQGADPEDYIKDALKVLDSQGIIRQIGYREGTPSHKQPADSALFRGALTELIHDYMQTNREPPNRDTIIKMGQVLAEQRAMYLYPDQAGRAQEMPKGSWPIPLVTPYSRRYQDAVPPEENEIISKNFVARYGTEPTPKQVHDLYISALYKNLFAKPRSTQPRSQSPNLLDAGHITND